METVSTYEIQATDFLTKTETTLKIDFLKHGSHFDEEKEIRDIYTVTIKRGQRSYTFTFGQSISKSKRFQDKLTNRIYAQNGDGINSRYRYLYPEKFPTNRSQSIYGEFNIIEGEKPTAYDVLACLQKYDVGTFEDFCGEFSYDTDSKKAEKTYLAVLDEYKSLCALYSEDEMQELQEIQ